MTTRDAAWFAEEDLTRAIIGAFYYVYNQLGFGFVESVYAAALERLLIRRGFRVAREVVVPIYFEHEIVAHQRLDFIVEDRVVLELKAGEALSRHAAPQLFNYLRATNLEIGFVFHFGKEPRFYRVACNNSTKALGNRSNPTHRSNQ